MVGRARRIEADDLALIASAIPFPRDQPIRVLDLCCGPGDVGRAIRKVYPNAQIDGIDRDPFFMAICRAVNQREGIPGKLVVRDLEDDGWLDELAGDYDVVATVNALHWFREARAGQLVEDVHRRLRSGGVFLVAEPASAEAPFAAGFERGRRSSRHGIRRRTGNGSGREPIRSSGMTTSRCGGRAMMIALGTS